MPEPRVNTWQDVGDVLGQGGTVHTEQAPNLSEQFPLPPKPDPKP